MQQNTLELLTHRACRAVQETAAFIQAELGKVQAGQIEEKHLNGLVSYVDRTAEEMLVARLSALLPDAAFLTEEETVENKAGALRWIIDPLDGTTNFLYQVPHFSISVALEAADELVLGIVHHVPHAETYYAWQGGGAYCNGLPIRTSQRAAMSQALVATGFPYHNFSRAEGWMTAIQAFMQQGRGMRRFGSAALDLAYVACGRFDIFFEYGLNAWDVAGGIVLVREAGGTITDFKGGPEAAHGGELLACNAPLHPAALAILESSFGKY
jgi:myo-inositol-1(or 4)-monophosphatase